MTATVPLLLDVIEAVNGPIAVLVEPVGADAGAALDWRLQVVIDQVVIVLRERLAQVSLVDLSLREGPAEPIFAYWRCDSPAVG